MNVYLEVYGCTANKADASLVKGCLKKADHKIVNNINDADVLTILTCTVIDTTQQRMLSRIKEFKKTGKKVIVAGCMASIQTELVKKILPNAIFLPPQYSHHISDLIDGKINKFVERNKTSFSKDFDEIISPISISEGCLFSCSYCITSLARGKLKSFPVDEIKKDVCLAIKQGCKEIQLTAQDTSSYGLDCDTNLGELLKNVCKIRGEYRIRNGMMNPYTCLKNLNSIIEGYRDEKIFKFLHLPVQSGDDIILKKMNRKYCVDDFLKIVKEFKKNYPNLTFSTDIIVGFPTETDEQFENSISLLKKVKPDIINITRFSPRPFTKAKKMEGKIKTEISKNRSKILSDLAKDISIENNKKYFGKKFNVQILEKGKNDTFLGRTDDYRPVVIKENVKFGEFIKIKVAKANTRYLVGSII